MAQMNRMWLVLRQEYVSNVRRRAFLVAALGIPLFIVILMLVILIILIASETKLDEFGGVGYVDLADIIMTNRELVPGANPDNLFIAYESEEAARQALNADEIGAYFIAPADFMETGAVKLYSAAGFPEALDSAINYFIWANLSSGVDNRLLVERAVDPVNLTIHTLDNNRELSAAALVGLFCSPLILVFALYFAVQIASAYLMSGVVEEKTNRIMEILITSVTPFELLIGKVLGLGLLGLTQLAIWLVPAGVGLLLLRQVDFFAGFILPPDLLGIGLLYFLLTYVLYGCLLGGIGAVAGSEQESRQIAGIFIFTMVLPFIFLLVFLLDPDGLVPAAFSMIPFTAAPSMIMRLTFGAVPPWQLVASLAILFLTTLFIAWSSAKVFRWSLLRYGKKPRLRDVLRALRRRSPRMETVEEA
jgi:ABC-2 type transport system permease protein